MKKPVCYKVDEKVFNDFTKLAESKSLNKSLWIQNRMKEFIKENEKEIVK